MLWDGGALSAPWYSGSKTETSFATPGTGGGWRVSGKGEVVSDGNLLDSQTGGLFYNKWWRENLGIHRDYQRVGVKL